jgi:hypothetical protein
MSMHDEASTNGSLPATSTDPTAVLNRRRRGVRVTYAAAVALGLAVGGSAVAGAATGSSPASSSTEPPGHHAGGPGGPQGFGGTPPVAFGTVASVGTGTFTLTSTDGTKVIVDVSSSTSYVEFGKSSASMADVTVGTHVAVFGTDTNNTVTATKVGLGSPTGGPGGPGGMHGPGGPGGHLPTSPTGTSSASSSTAS